MQTIEAKDRNIHSLPALDREEIADASFRARDRAWVAIAGEFEDRSENENLTYQTLAKRIGRSKAQVHRWLDSSCNMTLRSLGLLAEGLDVNLDILVSKRGRPLTNQCHPSESAANECRIGATLLTISVDEISLRRAPSPIHFDFENDEMVVE